MSEWGDETKRDQYQKICEILGLVDYPEGRSPYYGYPHDVVKAIYRLVDGEGSGWIPLEEGCRMPEYETIVLVTLFANPNTPTLGGVSVWIEPAMYLDEEFVMRDGESFPGPTYGDGEDRISITAWMPAPKPFVKGQP